MGFQAPTLSNAVLDGERVVSGVWGNVNPLSRHIWEPRKDELNSLGWNTKYKFADKWTANLDLSYSSAKSTNRILELEAGQYDDANNRPLPENVTVANYNQIASLQYDRNNLSTLRLTDPESWGQNGYDKIIATDDKLKAIRLSAQRDLDGLFARLDFGVNYTQRDKEKGSTEAAVRLTARCNSTTPTPLPVGCNPAIANPSAPLPTGTSAIPLPGTGLTDDLVQPGRFPRRLPLRSQRQRRHPAQGLDGQRKDLHAVREGRPGHRVLRPAGARQRRRAAHQLRPELDGADRRQRQPGHVHPAHRRQALHRRAAQRPT